MKELEKLLKKAINDFKELQNVTHNVNVKTDFFVESFIMDNEDLIKATMKKQGK